jgi:hypothetical protein
VVLNDQPQGGLANRKPAPAVSPWGDDDGYDPNRRNDWGSPWGDNRRDGGSPFGDNGWRNNTSSRGNQTYDRQQSSW